ncbi:uncharacterized protein LOC127874141 [Dreissena polymorpha]|uniref:uncharacterized protein LOC127874141 n=1 Tax=Dreissena polymorpha TaxID=45954 RepID=UPI002263F247|nr:uncharacterized protein LOC127874141 [Dreissena polymorpha]
MQEMMEKRASANQKTEKEETDVKLQVPRIQVDEAPEENLDPDTFDYETDYLAKTLNGHDNNEVKDNIANYEQDEEVAEDSQKYQVVDPVLESGVVIRCYDDRIVALNEEENDVTHDQDVRVASLDGDERDVTNNQDVKIAAFGREPEVDATVDEEEEMQVDICYGMNLYGSHSPACVWNVVVVVEEIMNSITHAASC